MKRYWKIGLAAALLISLVLAATSKETPPPYTEMEVKGVSIDTIGHSPVVLLADKEEKKALPIWIGLLEATAIDKELKNMTSPRPMTHDLLHSILTQVQVKVNEVKIVDLKDNTYFATLFLKSNKGVIEVDARPSDAIILALKSKIPILVATKILDEQGITLTQKSAYGERFGIRIQELTPALASHFNFKDRKGVLVAEVIPSSVSEAAGIKAGDIITKLNSKEVGSVQQFEVIFDTLGSNNPVRIFLFRDNKSQEVNLFLKR
ncbi:MAG: bifunctional nuclease domain-containing protein [Thermodesulfobacteriota bacterium]